jgi:D-serine deaminase-like pyridoxal phosphate-dependent protein
MDERQLERALAPSLDRLLTPALVVDLDAAAHNVRAVLARVGDPKRWRPHVKTVKQAAVVRVLLEAGVRSFKCATPAELELVLAAAGERFAADVLLAYPPNRALFGEALAVAAATRGGRWCCSPTRPTTFGTSTPGPRSAGWSRRCCST